jgi:hypothetical protein
VKTAARSLLRIGVGAVALAAAMAAMAGGAQAKAPIVSYSAIPSGAQAGGHPDVEIQFIVRNRFEQQSQSPCNCEDAKDATVHLPTGFIGNPSATPLCSIADFSSDECPVDSVVGAVEADVEIGTFIAPIYNLTPPPNVAGLTGFKIGLFDTPQFTELTGRTESDYGLDAKTTSIYHGTIVALKSIRQVLWGVPADPVHDPIRIDTRYTTFNFPWILLDSFCDAEGQKSTDDPESIYQPCFTKLTPTPSSSPEIPFLQNPTTCASPLQSSLDVLAYDGETDSATYPWPQPTGCFQLGFNPSLYAKPTTPDSDSAAGMDIELTVPQPLSPTIPSPSELRAASVTLPPGFSINPNAADGKVACADEEANFGTRNAAQCPDFSKVGSVEIVSSALPGPLPGFVYLGAPLPGNRYRIFLVADGFATHVKLAGTVTPNPETGQLTISFENLPQTPLSAFRLHFFGSERGSLATPTKCGTYAVKSTFVPWNDRTAPESSEQFFEIDHGPYGGPCPGDQRPFAPQFNAASAGNTAGAYSPFSAELTRSDGDQFLSRIHVTTPQGFLASIKGVPYCPEATIAQLGSAQYSGVTELASPRCPVASQIGTAVVGTGAGTRPLYVTARVFLAGPYKGSPLSLVVVAPAVSGPYDLGNVVARAAISVDPLTAQVTTASDTLPSIIEGIPLRMRSIRLSLDRPGFTLNPTNCDPHSIDGTFTGDEGAQAVARLPYQVANCQSLPYAPKLGITLSGGVSRRGHPAIHAVIDMKPGEANSRRIAVTLPRGELLDNSHIGAVCTRVAFASETCPPDSKIGEAEVTTPLLDNPLHGSIYLRSSTHQLPDLAIDLKGQFEIEAIGRVDSYKARLRTIFETLPDAPVSRIEVWLAGGSKGLLVNSGTLCVSSKRATVSTTGQNGVSLIRRPKVEAMCSKSLKAKEAQRSKKKEGRR